MLAKKPHENHEKTTKKQTTPKAGDPSRQQQDKRLMTFPFSTPLIRFDVYLSFLFPFVASSRDLNVRKVVCIANGLLHLPATQHRRVGYALLMACPMIGWPAARFAHEVKVRVGLGVEQICSRIATKKTRKMNKKQFNL